MHGCAQPKRIGVQHGVVRVEELVVHAIEDMSTVVGCQRCWARKGCVLCRGHRGRHVVRWREVLLREWAWPRRLVARVVVIVVCVGLFLVLLLYTTKSA